MTRELSFTSQKTFSKRNGVVGEQNDENKWPPPIDPKWKSSHHILTPRDVSNYIYDQIMSQNT